MTETVTINLDDRTMDRILDELTERAGHPRHSDALGLARWDLKAALEKHGHSYGRLREAVGADGYGVKSGMRAQTRWKQSLRDDLLGSPVTRVQFVNLIESE